MKSLAFLFTGILMLSSNSFPSAAAGNSIHRQFKLVGGTSRWALHNPFIPESRVQRGGLTLQTGTTPAGTTAATATATPATTPTPTGPDPVTLLRQMVTVYGLIRSAHFELTDALEHTGIEKLAIHAVGDVTCTKLFMKGTLNATDTLEGTSQVQRLSDKFVEYAKSAFLKGKDTKNRWKKTAQSQLSNLGVSVDNLLICPNSSASSGSASGGGSDQLKDLQTVGADTFRGHSVWHIRATNISVDATTGKTTSSTFDILMDKSHYLPYQITQTTLNPDQQLTVTQSQILTAFGKKVKTFTVRVGSRKP